MSIPPGTPYSTTGTLIYSGFPALTLGGDATLHVEHGDVLLPSGMTATITMKISGAPTVLATYTSDTAAADVTGTVPSGTSLDTVTVELLVDGSTASISSPDYLVGQLPDAELYIEA